MAAPFDVEAVTELLPHVDLISMNEVEAATFEDRLGRSVESADLPDVLVTRGAEGAIYHSRSEGAISEPAVKVEKVVDTTCAGDTYFGFFVSALARDMSIGEAMTLASAAAALSVTRAGASASIPTMDEVQRAMGGQQ